MIAHRATTVANTGGVHSNIADAQQARRDRCQRCARRRSDAELDHGDGDRTIGLGRGSDRAERHRKRDQGVHPDRDRVRACVYVFGFTSAVKAAGAVSAYSGVNTTNRVDVTATVSNGAQTSQVAPSATTTTANDVVVRVWGTQASASVTPPGGVTERGDTKTTGSNWVAVAIGDSWQGAVGATGTASASSSASAAGAHVTLALRPAKIAPIDGTYQFGTTNYDRANNLRAVTYPAMGNWAGQTVDTGYNATGQPTTLTSGETTLVGSTTFFDNGQLQSRVYGGATGASPNALVRSYSWWPETGRLLGMTLTQNSTTLQNDTHWWDAAGNLTAVSHDRAGTAEDHTECYSYDAWFRLTTAYTNGTSGATASCVAPAGPGGPAPLQASYGYDAIGNFTTGPAGSYTYPASGATSVRPHAPTQAGSNQLTWNADGSMATRTVAGSVLAVHGNPTDLVAPGDYDGDGDTDLTLYRPATATSYAEWWVYGVGKIATHGSVGDKPAPGDYDGDGDTEATLFRPSTSEWWAVGLGLVATYGVSTDLPAPGDYDGDGDTDVAVFRPSTNQWHVRNVGVIATFGSAGDIPAPGDYDGDGDTDVAVYRPSTGQWIVSGLGIIATYGTTGDLSAPGDYDGSGDTDVAVFRPSNGNWMAKTSTANYTWNALDQLAGISADGVVSTMIYGPGGQRIISKQGSDVHLFLGGYAERHYRYDTATIVNKRYYTIGATSVAVATKLSTDPANTAPTYDYLFGDVRGSTTLTVRGGTTSTQSQWYTPYGRTRSGKSTTPTTTRGYIGQQQDPSSLIYLNNRYHDPTLGTFISVDPLVAATGEPYIYASGNPTTLSDPSGLEPGCSTTATPAQVRTCAGSHADASHLAKNAPTQGTAQSWWEWQRTTDPSAQLPSWTMDMPTSGGQSIDWGSVAGFAAGFIPFADCGGMGAPGIQWGAAIGCGLDIGTLGSSSAVKGTAGEAAEGGLRWLDDLFSGGTRVCGLRSFSADTEVLMADGTTKPIAEIEIGDMVLAYDPETGERGPREVTHLWVHQDQMLDLDLDGARVTTTEDHPFWNATDRTWQDAQLLDSGDLVLTADGGTVTVAGLDWSTTFTGTAYNLTVDDIHTYYVQAGDHEILVHNTCLPGPGDIPTKVVNSNMPHAAEQALERAGFDSVQSSRAALQELSASIQASGFPVGTIADTRPGRVLVPFGDGGYAVYQIQGNGNAALKTVLEAR